MFDDLKAQGIKLDEIGEVLVQKQLDELAKNIAKEDLDDEVFMSGISRILCGALSYYIDTDFPQPLKALTLYAWIKYTFLAVIHLKLQKGFNLSYDLKSLNIDEFMRSVSKDFDTEANLQSKVTLAQEGEQDGERRKEDDGRQA